MPVIFVTALSSEEDETHGLKLGAVDYITKPYKPAIVLSRIRTHLELKDARDRLQDQNQWLELEVARRMKQNEVIRNVTTRALACLAEIRDNETGNHILRTKSYVNIIATELAKNNKFNEFLTPEMIDKITNAAPLHDIGKVGTPDSILNKPGKLTSEEWEVMKQHAKHGADSIWHAIQYEEDIEGLDFLYKAMEIARGHHEKYDGSGYPDGLKGENIPLSARIMALADVFDALVSKRVYKQAFSIDQAIDFILEGRGTHFDPYVVDAFITRKNEFISVAEKYSDNPS
ncbi:MAG: HD domain-containing protein [Betaproteobacteria bacterium]|nr:HD domain-containing protein [Betaproteobacteria bacterium]